jgi:hypothetical protein
MVGMADKDDKTSPARKLAAEALGNQGEDRRKHVLKGAEDANPPCFNKARDQAR